MMYKHRYCVILAGGSGERLWPLSRNQLPKQFLSVAGCSLLEHTISRIEPLVADSSKIWISTTAAHAQRISQVCGSRIGTIIVEPEARNTAPAMLYACYQLRAVDPDAEIIFVPADAFIPQHDAPVLREKLQRALAHIQNVPTDIVIMGVTPSYPATGYGYIEYLSSVAGDCYPVVRFHEKPSVQVAQYYLENGTTLWNIGIVVACAKTLIDVGRSSAPELSQTMQQVVEQHRPYADLPSISFDYAILERSPHVQVVPVAIQWSDVGNLAVLLALAEQYEKPMTVIARDAQNNLVYAPDKLVALVGVHDLCIVDTSDVLLIVRKSDAELVKSVVAQLKQLDLSDYV